VRSNGVHGNTTKFFGRAFKGGDCVPVGARNFRQEFVYIVEDTGNVDPKKQQTMLTRGRFFSTEVELGMCVSKLLDTPKDAFQEAFVKSSSRVRCRIETRRRW